MKLKRRVSVHDVVESIFKRARLLSENMDEISIKSGCILEDITSKKWKVGKSLGCGAFGTIYRVTEHKKEREKNPIEFVVKIEKHCSGPLFVEMNCYLRAAKMEMINDWLTSRKQSDIGMPHYVASGSHVINNDKYRFLILPKYGFDLERIFQARNRQFDVRSVFTIAIQMLDVLEYLHERGYIHADIKASNIMIGRAKNHTNLSHVIAGDDTNDTCHICDKTHHLRRKCVNYARKQNANQVYLLDYGLASRYRFNGTHKMYAPDMRKAHAGTVLFCSRDAHMGCVSRRSDLENLGYNLVYWLVSTLPWEDDVTKPELVSAKKCDFIDGLERFFDAIFDDVYPGCLLEYFAYVKSLGFYDTPNYKFCKDLFRRGCKAYDFTFDNRLYLSHENCDIQKKNRLHLSHLYRQATHGWNDNIALNENKSPPDCFVAIVPTNKKALRSAATKNAKRNTKGKLRQSFNWAEVIESNPEHILRQNNKLSKILATTEANNNRVRKVSETSDGDSDVIDCGNPTYAMLNVIQAMRRAPESSEMFVFNNSGDSVPLHKIQRHNGHTLAMDFVIYLKEKQRLSTINNEFVTKRITRGSRKCKI